jgi:hypothetical protein
MKERVTGMPPGYVGKYRKKSGRSQQCPVRKLLAKKIGKKISIEAFFS